MVNSITISFMNCKSFLYLTQIVLFSMILCVFVKLSNADENIDNQEIIKILDEVDNNFKKNEINQNTDNQDNNTIDKNIDVDDNEINNIKDNTISTETHKQQDAKQLQTQQEEKKPSKTLSFVDKWLIPEHNPAFGEDGHSIGIQYSYDIKRHLFPKDDNRELHNFAVQYSAPIKFLGIHGRTNLGVGYLYGQDYWAKNKDEGKYNTPLFELIQEFVIGNKYVYITFGIGISWIMSPAMDYAWKDEYTKNPSNTYQNGSNNSALREYNGTNYTSAGMSKLNFPMMATLGHRFKNGLVIELMWKHYSNGHLQHYNQEVNTVGISLRYTFGKK